MYELWEMRHDGAGDLVRTIEIGRRMGADDIARYHFEYRETHPHTPTGEFFYKASTGEHIPLHIWPAARFKVYVRLYKLDEQCALGWQCVGVFTKKSDANRFVVYPGNGHRLIETQLREVFDNEDDGFEFRGKNYCRQRETVHYTVPGEVDDDGNPTEWSAA